MQHLHAFLSIDDNLLIRRLNWVLGVPQYRYFDGHYALEFSENSEYVCYQSGLHYNSD